MVRIIGKCYLKDEKKKKIVTDKNLLNQIYLKYGIVNGAKHIGIGIQTMRRWLDKQGVKRSGKKKYLEGIKNPNRLLYFKTGGYICVNKRGWKKEIRLHKYLMEKYLKRKLSPKEHVHHIDGNKLNNKLNNLVVLSCSKHRKVECQLKDLALKFYKEGIIKWNRKEKKYYQREGLKK